MEKIKRAYTGKDVDMLTAIATIIEAAITHEAELVAKRPGWAKPFFSDLKTKIETVTQTHLGIDSLKDLRQATQVLKLIQKKALDDLTSLHVQVQADFSDDQPKLKEMLTTLGFKQYYKEAKDNKSQQHLVNLLYQFNKNMTAPIETDITANGVDPALIANIKDYAQTLNSANVTQESFKNTGTELKATSITALNEVYKEVIKIAKVASNFLKNNAAVNAKFSYSKTLKALSSMGGAEQPKTPAPKPA